MIDALNMVFPLAHAEPINGGNVVCIDPHGTIEWTTMKRKPLQGSWESKVHIRTASTFEPCTHVVIDGNPVKWVQGHNLWGTDDLHALAVATCHRVAELLGIQPTQANVDSWNAGDIQLLRVDIADSYQVGNSRGDVLAWLRAAEHTAHLKHKGRGQLTKGTTLYFGKHSRRSSLKIYSKGEEIAVKWKEQPALKDSPPAIAWAENVLRPELVLRSLELKRLGLNTVRKWTQREQSVYTETDGIPAHPRLMLPHILGNMTMTTTSALSAKTMDELRPALKTAVQSWEAGNDLRFTLTKATFYRYRAALLIYGIDIAMLNPKQGSNVIPLIRILEATPKAIPEWAYGTPLYFQPPTVCLAGESQTDRRVALKCHARRSSHRNLSLEPAA